MRTISILLGFVTMTLLAPAAAAAQDAREHFLRGQSAYEQGDYESAITEWNAAFELDPRPLLQFNLAQAYERLGRPQEAIAALEHYLQLAGSDDPHQSDARARLASLRERLARTGVIVEGGPEGAIILIDGEDHGRTPRPDPIVVTPGEHRIVVRSGAREFTASVVVAAGQNTTVHVDLPAEAAPPPAAPLPIAGIAVLSTSGVALVTAAILGGVASSTADQARTPDDSSAQTARGLAIGADVCFGISLAAAIAGTVLVIVEMGSSSSPASERASSDEPSVRVLPYADAQGAGATVSIGF